MELIDDYAKAGYEQYPFLDRGWTPVAWEDLNDDTRAGYRRFARAVISMFAQPSDSPVAFENDGYLKQENPRAYARYCEEKWRAAVNERDALRAALRQAVEALEVVEWDGSAEDCEWCGAKRDAPHEEDCPIGCALTVGRAALGEDGG